VTELAAFLVIVGLVTAVGIIIGMIVARRLDRLGTPTAATRDDFPATPPGSPAAPTDPEDRS
jgi:hypothetical protein